MESSADEKESSLPSSDSDRRFALSYIGWTTLDRRTTLPMLPWLVADIRRKSEKGDCGPQVQPRDVQLVLNPPLLRCVPSNNSNSSVFIFEHKAQLISRFIHNSNDLSYFAYLLRGQPDNPESEMSCHVFKAYDPNQVPEVISRIRQASKSVLKEETNPKQETEEAFYNSQKFEVLYCGKVTIGHKKAPSTLIDDCIDKFRQHEVERKRLRLLNGQRGSTDNTTVEFFMGAESDPLSAVLNPNTENTKVPAVDDIPLGGTGKAVSSSASQSSLRGTFPECILEDSGFEEPQEFRTRCSSLAGNLQRKPGENVILAPTRRRHASAPNNVQPSDADKNRTMLFQVGRFEINLISPDSKTVVLEKNFKDISSCCQGIKQTDHFGFICRDQCEGGPSQYTCYVFQCASESLVDEVMMTLKQAFSTAAALQSNKTPIQLCEACPMHDLHKLCERIEGLYPPRAKLAIQKYLSQLNDNEQAEIFERVQRQKPSSDQEENELVIIQLRQLCELKQKTHSHLGDAPQNAASSSQAGDGATSGSRFKLDVLKNKARSSLTSSLENIFARGASRMRGRLGSIGSIGSFDRDEESPDHSPPGSPPHFPDDDPEAGIQFRRRAHTFSHPPVKKRISFESHPSSQSKHAPLRRQQSVNPELLQSSPVAVSRTRSVSESDSTFSLPTSFSAPTFLKSIYQGSLSSLSSLADSGSNKSNGEGRKRTLSGCSTDSLSTLPLTPRRVSWRQKIFMRVASPMNKPPMSMEHPDHSDTSELLPLSPCALVSGLDPFGRLEPIGGDHAPGERPKRTAVDYRMLWKTAIHQQILLLRMEKENQRLEASRDELHIRKMKLNYEEVGQCSKDAQALWEKKLCAPGRTTVPQDKEEMYRALCQGVPKSRRGEVWLLLSHQHRLRHRLPQRQQAPDTPYRDLLKQLTAQQHAILVDLGRTFPTHQYFSAQLGAGQLSLYNLLKAYSLLDTEVGYCQGISFVAGVLLLHMSEEQAFDMLKFLMYDLGIRRQYRPDMISLQIQMYQLSRLLHDYHRGLYNHFEEHEICPSLYAAPWFLTLFASQFPLGFVSRLFDFVFAQGTEVIFKVALCLLSSHESEIVKCDNFESIVDYLKTTLPSLNQTQMEQTIAKVMDMDISKQLHAYEVEYHVLQDEMLDTGPLPDDSERLDKLEKTNAQLKKQNMDLLEKLQAARQKIQSLETSVDNFLSRESKMKHMIRSLEQERAAYQKTIERMRSCLPPDALTDVEMTQIKTGPNGKAKTAAKKP
ncbi:TBC1 domain family member 4 isoform X2 [Boleophthalmus pectinirostris]|uniref:TBC1 domain family member 4 isoform X2 n=1 Tax=Boleophthalmus pectinirostris TaxID=150288 RepID=UPI00242F4757|nr:TBC1 domain family member 4 isoform X2 [Boleophthalmus pectinirostris]